MSNSNWKEMALALRNQGLTKSAVARELGMPRSTVTDFLRKEEKRLSKVVPLQYDPKDVAFRSKERVKHLIIADTQCKPNHDLSYMKAIGEYIVDKEPEVIVHIGDHFDFESLSSYDRGKKSFEGRRLIADIEAGRIGMELLLQPLWDLQKKQAEMGAKVYSPRMIFCLGNHEERFDRISNDKPEFDGFVGTETLHLEEYGWEVIEYLKPIEVDGIFYVHYLANPFTGKPYGGSALNQLKTVGRSFVVGHKQCLDIAIRPSLDGKLQIGIVNGACYPHFEAYKGHTGNVHFRGVTMLHDVKDGFGNPCMVSLDYLMGKYL